MQLEKHTKKLAYACFNYAAVFSFGCLTLTACGLPEAPAGLTSKTHSDDDTQGNPGSGGSSTTRQSNQSNAGASLLGSALWQVECESDFQGQTIIEEQGGSIQFKGIGDHKISRAEVEKAKLQLKGEWCSPDTNRAVVIAVDVSKDMDYRCSGKRCGPDVVKDNGGCARADFAKAASQWAVERGHKLGYLTFSNIERDRSNGLSFNASTMNPTTLNQIFCDDVGNSDNWDIPLSVAENMLSAASPLQTKELVIVSSTDVPQNRIQSILAKADALKTKGYSVNVILLNGAEAGTMRANQITSADLNGQHFFSQLLNGTKLVSAFDIAKKIQIVSKELRFRSIGEQEWKSVTFPAGDADPNITLDTSFEIDGNTQTDGYEMELVQKDLRGRTLRIGSRIIFE